MIRKPIVEWQFYEGDKEKLIEQIKEFFMHKFGPGKLPEKGNKEISGIISPHAGFFFSGACAAHGFKEIGEAEDADLYILLGFSHSGYPGCVSLDDFETPLGIVKNDVDFTKKLIKNGLKENSSFHAQEHSIEVQLPFLQFVKKEVKFVPVFVDKDYEKITEIIKKTIKEQKKKKVIIVASSDFTHYGYNYGFVPFSNNVKENLYKLDKGAIDLIVKNDVKGFLDYCEKTGATICGKYPIACLMKILDKKGKLLKYYTSGDIINDYNSAVGYASIVF